MAVVVVVVVVVMGVRLRQMQCNENERGLSNPTWARPPAAPGASSPKEAAQRGPWTRTTTPWSNPALRHETLFESCPVQFPVLRHVLFTASCDSCPTQGQIPTYLHLHKYPPRLRHSALTVTSLRCNCSAPPIHWDIQPTAIHRLDRAWSSLADWQPGPSQSDRHPPLDREFPDAAGASRHWAYAHCWPPQTRVLPFYLVDDQLQFPLARLQGRRPTAEPVRLDLVQVELCLGLAVWPTSPLSTWVIHTSVHPSVPSSASPVSSYDHPSSQYAHDGPQRHSDCTVHTPCRQNSAQSCRTAWRSWTRN
jgi:hypothetical protein